jgi:hypothetical protein
MVEHINYQLELIGHMNPGAILESASLHIKWEVQRLQIAGAFFNDAGNPLHCSIERNQEHAVGIPLLHLQTSVQAVENN